MDTVGQPSKTPRKRKPLTNTVTLIHGTNKLCDCRLACFTHLGTDGCGGVQYRDYTTWEAKRRRSTARDKSCVSPLPGPEKPFQTVACDGRSTCGPVNLAGSAVLPTGQRAAHERRMVKRTGLRKCSLPSIETTMSAHLLRLNDVELAGRHRPQLVAEGLALLVAEVVLIGPLQLKSS